MISHITVRHIHRSGPCRTVAGCAIPTPGTKQRRLPFASALPHLCPTRRRTPPARTCTLTWNER